MSDGIDLEQKNREEARWRMLRVVDAGRPIAVSEQIIWRVLADIKLALAAAPEPHQPIAGIGLTGQMHGAVMLDEHGAVVKVPADLPKAVPPSAVSSKPGFTSPAIWPP